MICFIHAFTANHSKGKLILKNNRYMVESLFLEVLKRLLSDEWMERSDTFPVCDQYPVVSDVRQPLSSRIGASIILTGRLVDTNLDTCIPVRFRHSPTSIPYDTSLQGQSNNQEGSAKKNHPLVPTNNSEPIWDKNLSNNGLNLRVPLLSLSNFQIYDWPDLKTKCYLSMVLMLPSDSARQWHVHELELVELVADQVLGLEILEDDCRTPKL